MDKQRLEATHFAQVWRGSYYHNAEDVIPISLLQNHLNTTASMGYKTIAIWKIKFKQP